MLMWLGVVLLLIYLPIGLQRRMLTGFYIPLAGLSVMAIDALARGVYRKTLFVTMAVLLITIPTNLIVLMAARHGLQTQDPLLYLTHDEWEGLQWISANTDPEALILTGPEMGLYVPGQTGRRVLYGHPFETLAADQEAAKVRSFFEEIKEPGSALVFLALEGVDYIFSGPRERALGELPANIGWVPVFVQGRVEIYASPDG